MPTHTTAMQVAEHFRHETSKFTSPCGESLSSVALRLGARISRKRLDGLVYTRYWFPDRSSIITCPGFWSIAASTLCWCLAGSTGLVPSHSHGCESVAFFCSTATKEDVAAWPRFIDLFVADPLSLRYRDRLGCWTTMHKLLLAIRETIGVTVDAQHLTPANKRHIPTLLLAGDLFPLPYPHHTYVPTPLLEALTGVSTAWHGRLLPTPALQQVWATWLAAESTRYRGSPRMYLQERLEISCRALPVDALPHYLGTVTDLAETFDSVEIRDFLARARPHPPERS